MLAKHLVADTKSQWTQGFSFTYQAQCQAFLANRCYLKALALPEMEREALLFLEAEFIRELKPRYAGKIGI